MLKEYPPKQPRIIIEGNPAQNLRRAQSFTEGQSKYFLKAKKKVLCVCVCVCVCVVFLFCFVCVCLIFKRRQISKKKKKTSNQLFVGKSKAEMQRA